MANLHSASELDGVFRALADPTRRAVLAQLSSGEASVGELAADHAMALPTFMRHLSVLEEGGLIATRKRGRVRICAMRADALARAQEWIDDQRRSWNLKLDRLGQLLARQEEQEDEG